MAKPEWGIKRICQSCGILFYDFQKSPIICPKCEAQFDPEAVLKSRRNRMPAADQTKAKANKSEASGDKDTVVLVENNGGDGQDEEAKADDNGGGGELVPDVDDDGVIKCRNCPVGRETGTDEWLYLFSNEELISPFQDGHYIYVVIPGGNTGEDVTAPRLCVADSENPRDLHKIIEF